MYRPILALSLIAMLTVSANAAPTAKAHAKIVKHAVNQAKLICPVTGDTIPSVKEAAGHSTYKGKTYYFCCGGCKPQFDKTPAKFVKPDGTLKTAPTSDHGM